MLIKPRVITYIRKTAKIDFNPLYSLLDPDMQLIEIYGLETFHVLNVYNKRRRPNQAYTEDRLKNLTLNKFIIIVGDFNRHHMWWNPAADSKKEQETSILVDWLKILQVTLINNTDESIFFRQNMKNRSIIDLAFYILTFRKYLWNNWKLLPYTRSDHETIGFTAIIIELIQNFNTIKPA